VARVEIPFWIAEDPEKLELVHSILVAQIAKGQGYPVSLSEAHEQAVIRTADRDTFQMLVRNSFQDIATRTIESQKQRSKRTRWI
jgi:NurA-like 5'-3' nuclease